MLCCWLQQLQEFGGPEVEKPDLLQLGSVNSLRPFLQAGGGNIPRHTFFKDPRARYNVSISSTIYNRPDISRVHLVVTANLERCAFDSPSISAADTILNLR